MADEQTRQWRIVRWGRRVFRIGLIASVAYALILLIGLIPVNNSFQPTTDGIKLYVISNAVHADIIVPIRTDTIDWRDELQGIAPGSDMDQETHVAFGWGDKGFFLETPTWDDLKLSTAANALLVPSESCVHVCFTCPEYLDDAACVTVSEEQYGALVDHIKSTIKTCEDGNCIQIPGYAYGSNDVFLEAKGRYHLLNTCNSWVGRGLKSAGVRVPWLSPLPKTPMLYFSNKSDLE